MSTAPKSSKSSQNIIIYALIGGALLIVLICSGVLVAWAKPWNWSWGDEPSYGGKGKSKVTYPTGDEASTLSKAQVLDAFLRDLKDDRIEDAYDRTSTGFKGMMSLSSFREM